MPFLQGSQSVAANATVENLVTGSQFEFAPYNASVEVGMCASGVGLVGDVSTGSDVVAEAFSVANSNRFPILPDDFTIMDVVAAGERIKLRVRNTTGGALTIFWAVRIMPIR
jgi:hypothetical protein